MIHLSEMARVDRARLKSLPDAERRAEICILTKRLAAFENSPKTVSGTLTGLRSWVAQGHFLGNHTWDHPLLDTCPSEAQRHQIVSAHEWMSGHGFSPRMFANPNGNATTEAAEVANSLGYVGSVLFDHRPADISGHPHVLSRLRIDSTASMDRTEAILSGAHSALPSTRDRLVPLTQHRLLSVRIQARSPS